MLLARRSVLFRVTGRTEDGGGWSRPGILSMRSTVHEQFFFSGVLVRLTGMGWSVKDRAI